jgi:serine/threonine protein kinase
MTQDELIGKQLGEYRLESLLAQGGMARIYRAVDVRLKRYVVVKVIDPPFHNDPDYVMRFEREAQAIARLDHPNIVRLFRFDEQDDWLYMAMQHVDGADLGTILSGYRADGEFMEPEDASRIIGEICAALDYAHQKGIIHRDVKPANILLDRQGRAFLTDFGLALLVEVGTRGEIFGSPHYIAPEQAMSSAKAVPESDLYSVGVILFEIFTGDVPFNAPEPLDIALLHMSEEPPLPRQLRPEISPELEAVILKALAKDPQDRYPTGAALAAALKQSLEARSASSLLTKRSTAPRKTIPEQVALQLGQPSLPPVPAGVVPPTSEPIKESVAPRPVASPAGKRPWMLTGAALGLGLLLIAVFCAAILAIRFVSNRIDTNLNPLTATAFASAQSAATSSGTETETTLSFTPSPETEPVGLLPTATPTSYKLLIVRASDGNSLIVINVTGNVFPLSLLKLGSGKDAIAGSAWGVDYLAGRACVGAWKAGEPHRVSSSLDCTLVRSIERKKKDLSGGATLAVYYDGEKVGTCEKNQNECTIQFSP